MDVIVDVIPYFFVKDNHFPSKIIPRHKTELLLTPFYSRDTLLTYYTKMYPFCLLISHFVKDTPTTTKVYFMLSPLWRNI